MSPSCFPLLLTSPHAVVAALPYLLGFQPRDCIVLLWVRGSRLILTQRLDLPEDVSCMAQWVDAAWLPPSVGGADEVVIAIVSAREDLTPVVDGLLKRSGEVEIRDVLRVDQGRWWSLMCVEGGCCPPEGRSIDPVIADKIRRDFAREGVTPLASREDVEAECSVDPGLQRSVGLAARALAANPQGVGIWTDECVALILRAPQDPTPTELAMSITGLTDVVIRDIVLWEMLRVPKRDLLAIGEFLRTCLRATTKRGRMRRAPVATVAAVASWLVGDGVRANTAIDAALRASPSYPLALLVGTGLHVGLPPEHWRAGLAGLTREQCRGPMEGP